MNTVPNFPINNQSDTIPMWEEVSRQLKIEFGEEVFDKWLSKLELLSTSNQEMVLSISSKFFRDWIKREYLDNGGSANKGIKGVITKINPNLKNISIIHVKSKEEAEINSLQQKNNLVNLSKYDNVFALGTDLNPKFTFDNFVVGKCNKLAYSIARIASGAEESEFISEGINPLFLYGGVGLGKTHLSQAVAWHIKENDKSRKVIYLSAERFMHQFVKALKNKSIMEFKDHFRSIDTLIIDDLQFISGKEGTQEELLYTLSHLIENNKQVILACDRSPGDLTNICEKLKSRIGGGVVADFKCPDYETRLEILKSKTKNLNLEISNEVMELLATRINSNIRDLEGAMKKMVANHMFTGEEINVNTTKALLKDLFRTNHNSTTIEQIQKNVALHFNIKIADLKSSIRARNVARPRQIAMYLAKNLTSKSLPEIGQEFGGKNHATIIHAVKKVEELMFQNGDFASDVKTIEGKF